MGWCGQEAFRAHVAQQVREREEAAARLRARALEAETLLARIMPLSPPDGGDAKRLRLAPKASPTPLPRPVAVREMERRAVALEGVAPDGELDEAEARAVEDAADAEEEEEGDDDDEEENGDWWDEDDVLRGMSTKLGIPDDGEAAEEERRAAGADETAWS